MLLDNLINNLNIKFKKIAIFQIALIFIQATIAYFLFYEPKTPPSATIFISYWVVFILLHLFFLKFFVLPSDHLISLLNQKNEDSSDFDLDWNKIESHISQKDKDFIKMSYSYQNDNLKYTTLLNALFDPVCIFSKDQTVHFTNKAFNQLFSLQELSNHLTLLEITRNLDFQEFIVQTIKTNSPLTLQEFSFSPLQENYKSYFKIRTFPLEDSGNFFCIMENVTERKSAETMREEFVANFSHEIRTPLTILNGQFQLIETKLSSHPEIQTEMTSHLSVINNNTRRLTNLFNDLLKLISIEKKKEISKDLVNLEHLTFDVFNEITSLYPDKKVELKTNFALDQVRAEYNLLEQVFINLIDNSFKYSTTKSTITISSKISEGNALIELSDTGIGIPEGQLHRIFERFYRVNVSRSSAIQGNGLGLSIVKHIIHKHRGKIKVDSALGEGTKFTITLPLE